MTEKPDSPMKKLTKRVSESSAQFLDSFMNDPDIDVAQEEEKKQKMLEQQEFVRRLKQAAEKKSILVLQVRGEKKGDKPETISGWVATKAIDDKNVMIRLQSDDQQIRMIPIDRIRKIASLSPEGEQDRISRE